MPPQNKTITELKDKVQYQNDRNKRLSSEAERISSLVDYAKEVEAPQEIIDFLQNGLTSLNNALDSTERAMKELQEITKD